MIFIYILGAINGSLTCARYSLNLLRIIHDYDLLANIIYRVMQQSAKVYLDR